MIIDIISVIADYWYAKVRILTEIFRAVRFREIDITFTAFKAAS